YSNFTFFLEDSVNGDQIKQKEKRNLYGGSSELLHEYTWGNMQLLFRAGAGVRYDAVNNLELSHTANRTQILEVIQLGNVDETNTFAYANTEWVIGDFLINPGVRIDRFRFQYDDLTDQQYSVLSHNKTVFGPKLNIIYNPKVNIQYYLKSGIGFHSNDTRTILFEKVENALPKSIGADVGTMWKPSNALLLNVGLWTLFMEQEFVYVGDAGVVEPGGETMRNGIDFSLRFEITKGLFLYSDFTYSHARALDQTAGENYIPLAPVITSVTSLTYKVNKGFYSSVRSRFLSDRPANENNTVIAEGYFITDVSVGYLWRAFDLNINIENILNAEWNETQFNTESRLYDEPYPVEEIHFTPGTPLFIKGSVRYSF
ncbi:MAG: TonB-dependent receptor domain-containing protein, partial [Chitinophagales bacterium]